MVKEDAPSTLPTATRQSWLVSPASGSPALSLWWHVVSPPGSLSSSLGPVSLGLLLALAPFTEGEHPTAQTPQ